MKPISFILLKRYAMMEKISLKKLVKNTWFIHTIKRYAIINVKILGVTLIIAYLFVDDFTKKCNTSGKNSAPY